MLLFIGFNGSGISSYVRIDPDAVRLLQLTRLPAASTFWRYVDSLGIIQAQLDLELNGTSAGAGLSALRFTDKSPRTGQHRHHR